MSLFENENLAIFAGNSQKDSLINYSKISQKYSLFRTMTLLQPQIVSVMHWRLDVMLLLLGS